jgi:ferrochelatase
VPVTTVGDYVFHITSAAEKIAKRVNLNHWCTAWQSAPPYGEWLGPTIETVIEQALLEGAKRIICVPFGFVSDHVEILYDNDILCRRIVEATGAVYERVPMPNGNALFMEGMAEAIKERINK